VPGGTNDRYLCRHPDEPFIETMRVPKMQANLDSLAVAKLAADFPGNRIIS
jgi:hypothetical protein